MRTAILVAYVSLALGCKSSTHSMPPAPDMAIAPTPMLLRACADAIADVYTAPAGLPAFDASHRGDVIRCGFDKYIPAAQLNAQMNAYGYIGAPLPSGAWLFRLAYRTERIPPAGSSVT